MKFNWKNKKKMNKSVSIVSILLFGVVFFIDAFHWIDYDVAQFKSLFVIIYFLSSYNYYKLTLKESKATIASLEQKLKAFQEKE